MSNLNDASGIGSFGNYLVIRASSLVIFYTIVNWTLLSMMPALMA
jgi:hypothetical protein